MQRQPGQPTETLFQDKMTKELRTELGSTALVQHMQSPCFNPEECKIRANEKTQRVKCEVARDEAKGTVLVPGAHLYCSCSQRPATIASKRLMKDSLLLSLFACAAKSVHLFSVSASFFCSLTYSCRRSIKCFSNLATSSARQTKNVYMAVARKISFTTIQPYGLLFLYNLRETNDCVLARWISK